MEILSDCLVSVSSLKVSFISSEVDFPLKKESNSVRSSIPSVISPISSHLRPEVSPKTIYKTLFPSVGQHKYDIFDKDRQKQIHPKH